MSGRYYLEVEGPEGMPPEEVGAAALELIARIDRLAWACGAPGSPIREAYATRAALLYAAAARLEALLAAAAQPEGP